MKSTLALLLALTVLTPAAVLADEPVVEIKKEVKVIVAGDDADVIQLDGDDLEVGESRQFFTDAGKEVLITRTDDGIEVEVDGEDLEIGTAHKQRVVIKSGAGDLDEVRHILVEALGDCDDDEDCIHGEHSFVFHGEDGHEIDVDGGRFHWTTTGDDGEPHTVFMQLHKRSAADHLEASGALDNLDAATRAEVLEALKAFDASSPHIEHLGGEHDIRIIRRQGGEHEEH